MSIAAHPLELAKRRRAPDLYILDSSYRVSLSWSSGRGAQTLLQAGKERLQANVESAVRKITADASLSEFLTFVPPDLILRVVVLEGVSGLHWGVFAEPFQARDALRDASRRYKMTRREVDVLTLLVQSSGTAEIAASLHIAETTVQDHIKNIAAKTNARSRMEIVAKILNG